MIAKTSPILIYGICEKPKILLDAYRAALNPNAVNRQYICLKNTPENIRIGNKGWLELMPDQLLQFEKNQDIFIFATEMLLSKTQPFSKPLRNALISYFNWVREKSEDFSAIDKKRLADPLFSNPEQICFSAYLPLPHPKIPLCSENGDFEGAASFDLGFHIAGKTYLVSFSGGEFVRKSERELRQRIFNQNDGFSLIDLPKPMDNSDLDQSFINNLLSSIPAIASFTELGALPHGLYYPADLNKLQEIG